MAAWRWAADERSGRVGFGVLAEERRCRCDSACGWIPREKSWRKAVPTEVRARINVAALKFRGGRPCRGAANTHDARVPGVTPLPFVAPRVLWLMVFLCCGSRVVLAADETLPEAWQALADNRAKDAFILLDAKKPGDNRERELARATTMLDAQPVDDAQLRTAEGIFVELAKGDDEIAQVASYLRARLRHVHGPRLDLEEAARLYREVAERWPQSHWGQLALVKVGLLALYAAPEPKGVRERIANVTKLLERIQEPPLRRDLQFQIGRAGTFFELPPAEVLPYLEAADEIGGLGALTQQDLTAELGELSFRAGRWTKAKKYFERYLAQYPDARKYTVEQRLKQIEAKLAGAQEAAQ